MPGAGAGRGPYRLERHLVAEPLEAADQAPLDGLPVALVEGPRPPLVVEIGGVTRFAPDPETELPHRPAKHYLGLDRFPGDLPPGERVTVVVEPRHATYLG